jgi:hypothetical protein
MSSTDRLDRKRLQTTGNRPKIINNEETTALLNANKKVLSGVTRKCP